MANRKKTKEQFIDIISKLMNIRRMDNYPPESPLGLDKTVKRGTNARRDMEDAEMQLKNITAEMQGWRAHREKAITEAEKTAVDKLLLNLKKEKDKLDTAVTQMLKQQTSLLGVGKGLKKVTNTFDFLKAVKNGENAEYTHKKGKLKYVQVFRKEGKGYVYYGASNEDRVNAEISISISQNIDFKGINIFIKDFLGTRWNFDGLRYSDLKNII